MSQANQTNQLERGIEHDQSSQIYELIATIYELNAIGDSDGVTIERLRCDPTTPTAEVEDLLEELQRDGIVERIKLDPQYAVQNVGRCNSCKPKWEPKPRFRLRS